MYNKCFTATPKASPKSCPDCKGKGWIKNVIMNGEEQCLRCKGTGKTP